MSETALQLAEESLALPLKVFPGVEILVMRSQGELSLKRPFQCSAEMLEAICCFDGVVEHECAEGALLRLKAGELAVCACPARTLRYTRAIAVSIAIDMKEAQAFLSKLPELGLAMDLREIKRSFCGDKSYHVLRPGGKTIKAMQAMRRFLAEDSDGLSLLALEFLFLLRKISKDVYSCQAQYFPSCQLDAVRKIRAHLAENLSRRITLEDLSKMFGMPLTTMKICFKSVYGESIGQHAKGLRMTQAAELLSDSLMPVADIAEKVGYESHAKFSAAFKCAYGCTPSEYRKASPKALELVE
ncbi:MAG: AraC family transcriptional regulator [Clostridiales bacterium]|jgi:AraC-like DNA-binding protein|nr:AraC family transcriptional regulator [Clostridiales bacterium]